MFNKLIWTIEWVSQPMQPISNGCNSQAALDIYKVVKKNILF